MGKLKRANQIRREQGYRALFRKTTKYITSETSEKSKSYEKLCEEGVPNRPHYGFCAYHACRLATKLGHDSVSLIEFGVASGNGLVNLEMHAEELEERFDIHVEVYGFDTGEGLPEPRDYRDCPYLWKGGHFEMDIEALESRIQRSELVLGDVKDTVPNRGWQNYLPMVEQLVNDGST